MRVRKACARPDLSTKNGYVRESAATIDSIEEILSEYPYLQSEDIEQALRFTERTALSQLGPV